MSAFVVSVSVIVAVMAYLNESNKQRRQFTMELALPFFSGELQDAKERLFLTIQSIQMKVEPARLGASDLQTYIAKSEEFSNASDRKLNSALLALSSFFNSAERCTQSGLCDAELMRDLISKDAMAIHCVFSGYLNQMAISSNTTELLSGLAFFKSGECE
ncbi:DUF4760 domain-containing protein [Hoeflea halophila]|uniref:DUF4760 domain-containing protein n=1 Tax=Hoeflea halophila TaxID=714899 RepID=UPI00117B5C59|nr:hypothetical protein [Hoeflea halophila]